MYNMTRSTSGKACDACRRRKLKCSHTLNNPSGMGLLETRCVRCIQTDLQCTFNDEQRKRGPKTGKRLRALRSEQQFSNLEGGPEEQGTGVASRHTSDLTSLLSPGLDEDGLSISGTTVRSTPICPQDAPNETPQTTRTASSAYDLFPQSTIDASEILGLAPLNFTIEANSAWNDYLLPSEQELQLCSPPVNGFPILKENLIAEIDHFFKQSYIACPVLHHETLMRKINEGIYLSDRECGSLMLSIIMFNEACKLRRSPQHGQLTMHYLAKRIENLRTDIDGCHFSENSSIDAVIVSLFLFSAYNISNKHHRAFCYLTEAIGLLDLVEKPSDPVEAIRLRRLEYVVFIAESATVSIYGSQRKRMISRRPSSPLESGGSLYWYNEENEFAECMVDYIKPDLAVVDEKAVDLLLLMTRLHLATGVTEVARITVDDRLISSTSRDSDRDAETQNIMDTTQTADVAITRQWKLAALWWNDISHRSARTSSNLAVDSTLEMIAITTLTWSKTLDPGCLRIIGLGKVVALIESILNISSKLGVVGSYTGSIRHLIQTVAEADYDQYFVPQLSVTEICIGDIPRSLFFNNEFEHFIYDTEQGLS